MDKEKATKLLAEQLVKANGQTFVTDFAHKKQLLEKAVAYYPVEHKNPFTLKFRIQFLNSSQHAVSGNKLDDLVKGYHENLIKTCSEVTGANYIFVENSQSFSVSGKYSESSAMSLMGNMSFFALIGDKETKNLQRMFYKDADTDIIRAMQSLKIESFVSNYKFYKENSNFLANYRALEHPDRFLELVFTIPEGDQVLEKNKGILRRFSYYIDYIEILTKEYFGGKHFQDYFNSLDFGCKKQVFERLRNIIKRNIANDYFLWANGFKEVRLDHIELYKDDASKFIEYFKNRDIEDKKTILKDIMNCESTNEEIVKWLNDNYLDLIREVGFNG
ncbi:hypothetical protein FJZ53_01600 [Candidatus Woesearchaeota archaeon]|nr:hypothetical protein [Candidatus Woesearchaeota archaeon]